MLNNFIEIPKHLYKEATQTGSSVICNPPVLDTDIDFIVYTTTETELNKFLIDNGVTLSCLDEEEYDMESEGFACYRKDNLNLIVTSDELFYNAWCKATKLAKRLNLLKKEDRITLFKFVLYDEITFDAN